MKKFFKKIVATGIAAMTIASAITAITAFAGNVNFTFNLTPSVNYGYEFTQGEGKDDNEQKAYVNVTSSDLDNDDLFYVAVFSAQNYNSTYRVTNWKRITGNGLYTLDYTTWRGQGSINYLCGDTDRNSVYVSGIWCP